MKKVAVILVVGLFSGLALAKATSSDCPFKSTSGRYSNDKNALLKSNKVIPAIPTGGADGGVYNSKTGLKH